MAGRLNIRRDKRRPTKLRLHKPKWVDPYPWIPGTEPEKRIFAALVQHGIYFIYQGQVPEFEKGGTQYFMAPVAYKPDFVLPEYKVIIDPFSPFHHSQPKAVERDIDKIARYEYIGYHYYHPWAIAPGVFTFDQTLMGRRKVKVTKFFGGRKFSYTTFKLFKRGELHSKTFGAHGLLSLIPEIRSGPRFKLTDPRDIAAKKKQGYRLGPYLGAGANSVGAANRRRRRPPKLKIRYTNR